MDEKFTRGVAVGIVAAAALLLFAPSLATTARPAVRRGMKSAVKAFARGREALAEFQELAEDAYAEAWAELKSEAEADERTPAAKDDDASAPAREMGGEPKRKRRARA